MAQEIEEIDKGSIGNLDLSIPYRTAIDKATKLLKSPYSVWQKIDIHEKHRLFYFLFEEKLSYSRTNGYRTDKNISAVRLFEEFATSNTLDVEMGGIEPPCSQCEYIFLQA